MSDIGRIVAISLSFFRIRAHSTIDYTVVMDYLQFENDMVFNYLISQTDIATTLVLTDEQAEHLFSDQSRVPRNARKAITREFYRYFPAGNNKNYRDGQKGGF